MSVAQVHRIKINIFFMEKKKISVVIFIDSLRIGGMHKQLLYLARHIDYTTYELTVCTSRLDGGLLKQYRQTKCGLVDLKWKRSFDLSVLARLVKYLHKSNPDVVFVSEAQNFIYFRLASVLWRRRAFKIGSFRALTFWKGHYSKFYKIIDDLISRWLYDTSDIVVVNSIALKTHYSKIISTNTKSPIKVIYNGSDFNFPITKTKDQIRRELQVNSEDLFLVMVARLDPWKDFKTLFEAIHLSLQRIKKIKCYIIGGGELRNSLESMRSEYGLDSNLYFLGETINVYNYLAASDIAVLSTFGEGFSNSILEAMGLGTPVIATDVGGNAELISVEDACGILVEPKSAEELSNAIISLANNQKLGDEFSKNAKDRIFKMCNINQYVYEYQKLFNRSKKII
jgi:glycosyltransferase involved in cell wall biosynthesis